ncbi:hypothetical protein ACHAPT_009774 [Fusarium lateritium]
MSRNLGNTSDSARNAHVEKLRNEGDAMSDSEKFQTLKDLCEVLPQGTAGSKSAESRKKHIQRIMSRLEAVADRIDRFHDRTAPLLSKDAPQQSDEELDKLELIVDGLQIRIGFARDDINVLAEKYRCGLDGAPESADHFKDGLDYLDELYHNLDRSGWLDKV